MMIFTDVNIMENVKLLVKFNNELNQMNVCQISNKANCSTSDFDLKLGETRKYIISS